MGQLTRWSRLIGDQDYSMWINHILSYKYLVLASMVTKTEGWIFFLSFNREIQLDWEF